MRQGQNNGKRSRGRGRRQQNPSNRSYESNGPDVKIRGNANTIVEKYLTLARDAQSAGDRVIAENYLQHAEHYQRILNSIAPPERQQDNRDNARTEGDDENAGGEQNTGNAQGEAIKVDAADAPQPEIADTVQANGEDPEQDGAEEKPKRRTRRARKPQNDDDATKAETSDAAPEDKAEAVAG